MEWSKKGIKTYIDDELVMNKEMQNETMYKTGNFSEGTEDPWVNEKEFNAPFNQKFYISMRNAVGGTKGFFPEEMCEKPYQDDSEEFAVNQFYDNKFMWYPDWNLDTNDAALKIDYIKVYNFTELPIINLSYSDDYSAQYITFGVFIGLFTILIVFFVFIQKAPADDNNDVDEEESLVN